MSKQAMREEAERLIKEAMERKSVTVTEGDTRIENSLRQVRRAEQGQGAARANQSRIHLQGMRPQAARIVSLPSPPPA